MISTLNNDIKIQLKIFMAACFSIPHVYFVTGFDMIINVTDWIAFYECYMQRQKCLSTVMI